MGATEETFYALAVADGLRLERRVRLPWLTNRGHLDAAAGRATGLVLDAAAAIHQTLGGDARALAGKRRGSDPLIDFRLSEPELLIEVDEIQHFTTDRRRSLDLYPDDHQLGFDRDAYLDLVARWRTTGDRYRAAKRTTDFDFPGGRRAQRAYFDAVRDLFAPSFGARLIRVPAPECAGALAYQRFRLLVEAAG